jgi:uncharacterized integral membrane protein
MTDDDKSKQKKDQGVSFGTIAAIVCALIIGSLVAANTTRININFVVYKAHSVPLWLYTLIIVALTIITDRILRFFLRRRKAHRNKKRALPN